MRFLKSYETSITDDERLQVIFEAFSEKYLSWGIDLYIKDENDQICVEHLNLINDANVKALVNRKIGRHHTVSVRNWLLGKCKKNKGF